MYIYIYIIHMYILHAMHVHVIHIYTHILRVITSNGRRSSMQPWADSCPLHAAFDEWGRLSVDLFGGGPSCTICFHILKTTRGLTRLTANDLDLRTIVCPRLYMIRWDQTRTDEHIHRRVGTPGKIHDMYLHVECVPRSTPHSTPRFAPLERVRSSYGLPQTHTKWHAATCFIIMELYWWSNYWNVEFPAVVHHQNRDVFFQISKVSRLFTKEASTNIDTPICIWKLTTTCEHAMTCCVVGRFRLRSSECLKAGGVDVLRGPWGKPRGAARCAVGLRTEKIRQHNQDSRRRLNGYILSLPGVLGNMFTYSSEMYGSLEGQVPIKTVPKKEHRGTQTNQAVTIQTGYSHRGIGGLSPLQLVATL